MSLVESQKISQNYVQKGNLDVEEIGRGDTNSLCFSSEVSRSQEPLQNLLEKTFHH